MVTESYQGMQERQVFQTRGRGLAGHDRIFVLRPYCFVCDGWKIETRQSACMERQYYLGRFLPGFFCGGSMRVIAYYMPNTKVTDIPVEHLTHCILAFATIKPTGEVAIPSNIQAWLRATQDKRRNDPLWKRVTFQLAVGGWTGSAGFSDMAADLEKRFNFVMSCVRVCNQYGISGIDLDWEFPQFGGLATTITRKEDKKNFTDLVTSLRYAFAAYSIRRPVLSAAIAASEFGRWDFRALTGYGSTANLDYLNVMTYDYNGPWDESQKIALHNAPLSEVIKTMGTLKGLVQSPQILNLGLPFYGRAWKTTEPFIGSLSSGPGRPDAGSMSYRDIEFQYLREGIEIRRTEKGDAFVFVPAEAPEKHGTLITFDDVEMIKKKAEMARNHFGGVMFWELRQDSDDWQLLKAIKG